MQIYGYQKHDNYMNINWNTIREIRDHLLKSCDWTQLPDVSIPDKADWAAYRQSLRDIIDQTDPCNIVWPVAPE